MENKQLTEYCLKKFDENRINFVNNPLEKYDIVFSQKNVLLKMEIFSITKSCIYLVHFRMAVFYVCYYTDINVYLKFISPFLYRLICFRYKKISKEICFSVCKIYEWVVALPQENEKERNYFENAQ